MHTIVKHLRYDYSCGIIINMPSGSQGEAERFALAVAEEISVLLARRKMSQRQLAKLINRSATYVSQRIIGKKPFDLNDMSSIAEALGVKLSTLFFDAEKTMIANSSKSKSIQKVTNVQ